MSSCLQTVLCCWKSKSSNRLLYQSNDVEERGIEYDRLIELPECNIRPSGRVNNPKLILNERERHLISNKLYSEYAEDQDRFNRLADEELSKDEERLAQEEEMMYAQKTSKIREFYQNRPLTTSSGENNFADFSERFNQTESCAVPVNTSDSSRSGDRTVTVSNHVPSDSQSVVNVSNTNVDRTSPVHTDSDVIRNQLVDNIHRNTDHVKIHARGPLPDLKQTTLSVEQSDKLLQDIDNILQDNVSETSDISEFYPDNYSDRDDLSSSGYNFQDTTTTTGDISEIAAEFYLTNVGDTQTPSPDQFVMLADGGRTEQDGKLDKGTSSTFDPFVEFTNKNKKGDCSSEESYVKVE